MITQSELTINKHLSDEPQWIAVIKGDEAHLVESMQTETVCEIVEGESKESLITAMEKRGLTVIDNEG